jgi:hypothetical protein
MFRLQVLRLKFAFQAIALLCALTSAVARADDIPPDMVRVSTPVYRPDSTHFIPPLGTYEYDVSWEGIPAAEASISVEQEGLYYRVTTTARTLRAIDLLYKLRFRAEGVISSVDYFPVKTVIDQTENSKVKSTLLVFHPDGEIEGGITQKGKEDQTFRFNPNNFTLDPVSAAFIARGLDWEVGASKQFDTFNGKTRYLITFTAVDKVTMKVSGVQRDVWVIVPKVQSLSDPEGKTVKKLRDAKIYITADPAREILQIRSSVFIGSVVTQLNAFTPSTQGAQRSTSVAHLNGRVFIE